MARRASSRLLCINLDQARDVTPFAPDREGKPLSRKPFKDARVRLAISKAINRQAIVERLQEGLAIPAGGVIPEGFFGSAPARPLSQRRQGRRRCAR